MSDENHARDQAYAQFRSIKDLMDALHSAEESDDNTAPDPDYATGAPLLSAEDLRDRIQERPLSLQVRSDWHSPGEPGEPAEYNILLCTGGPAVRIVGQLDQYRQPETADLEYQDWFTPWTRAAPQAIPKTISPNWIASKKRYSPSPNSFGSANDPPPIPPVPLRPGARPVHHLGNRHKWSQTMTTIAHRYTNAVLFEDNSGTLAACVTAAARANADLSGAYLSGADLIGADLIGADLSGADLSGAYLSGAYLSGADLSGADLSGADLRRADLRRAYLRRAYLSGAYLIGADLRRAYLSGADLIGAYLSGADLSGAYLSGADLSGADLRHAYLSGADLGRADLTNTKLPPLSILAEGPILGWKKCQNGVLVKVRIPENARRSNSTDRKCRAEFVEVVEIIGADSAVSNYDEKTIYRVGETVTCDAWCEDWTQECAGGIHFFITRAEAEAY